MQSMDPEVVKQVSQALKGVAVIAGGLKLSSIIKAFLGPAVDEFAQRIRDEVRLYRFGRQLKCLEKAEKMVQDAGFNPNVVPLKILFPVLDAASMEEDEDIHTMWAALLANASLPSSDVVGRRS